MSRIGLFNSASFTKATKLTLSPDRLRSSAHPRQPESSSRKRPRSEGTLRRAHVDLQRAIPIPAPRLPARAERGGGLPHRMRDALRGSRAARGARGRARSGAVRAARDQAPVDGTVESVKAFRNLDRKQHREFMERIRIRGDATHGPLRRLASRWPLSRLVDLAIICAVIETAHRLWP